MVEIRHTFRGPWTTGLFLTSELPTTMKWHMPLRLFFSATKRATMWLWPQCHFEITQGHFLKIHHNARVNGYSRLLRCLCIFVMRREIPFCSAFFMRSVSKSEKNALKVYRNQINLFMSVVLFLYKNYFLTFKISQKKSFWSKYLYWFQDTLLNYNFCKRRN